MIVEMCDITEKLMTILPSASVMSRKSEFLAGKGRKCVSEGSNAAVVRVAIIPNHRVNGKFVWLRLRGAMLAYVFCSVANPE
jgi:hypothetical protein